jgi:hypothetical protein
MYARITFESGQQFSLKRIQEIEHTIADQLDKSQRCKEPEGRITSYSTWSYSDDPENEDVKSGKKKLVTFVDLYEIGSSKEYIVDLDLFLSKHPELKIKLRGTPPNATQDYSSLIQQIVGIQDKFENALKMFDQQIEFNQKCDVHVANLGLLNINQLGYAVDYCTEQLQEILNKGWRIIACCVQPDGRRPDYILGRYVADGKDFECVKF